MYLGNVIILFCSLLICLENIGLMYDGICYILVTGEQYVMLVFMLILVEQVAEEMTWNLLPTHLFSFFVVGFLGKDIRLSLFGTT